MSEDDKRIREGRQRNEREVGKREEGENAAHEPQRDKASFLAIFFVISFILTISPYDDL